MASKLSTRPTQVALPCLDIASRKCKCITAGIVDYHRVAKSFAADVAALGGTVLTNTPLTGVDRRSNEFALLSHNKEVAVYPRYVVNAAGLYADRVAQVFGGSAFPKLVPVRGDFMKYELVVLFFFLIQSVFHRLVDGRNFRSMVYPVPNPVRMRPCLPSRRDVACRSSLSLARTSLVS
jgi:L-2-hydroxyglutarate oxidase LhgO